MKEKKHLMGGGILLGAALVELYRGVTEEENESGDRKGRPYEEK